MKHTIMERSVTPERSAARERYGSTAVKVVATLEQVLSDPEVQVVVISTPNSTHYPFAKVGDHATAYPFSLCSKSLDNLQR